MRFSIKLYYNLFTQIIHLLSHFINLLWGYLSLVGTTHHAGNVTADQNIMFLRFLDHLSEFLNTFSLFEKIVIS